MDLKQLLLNKRAAILERWSQLVTETYPAHSLGFLKQEKDRFANPVGHAISKSTGSIFDELLGGVNFDKLAGYLDNIIRIRAVQDFSPSQAVSFMFLLKKAIREELSEEICKTRYFNELSEFESKIDEIALLAFDVFMKCREKIYELRVNEVRAERERAFRLLEKANLLCFIPEDTVKEGSQES